MANPSSVVFTASHAGSTALAGASIYSATKAAVISLGRTLAVESAQRGVRVNVLSPGPIDPPILKKAGLLPDQLKGFEEKSLEAVRHIRRSGSGCKIPTFGGFEQHDRLGVDRRRRRSTELSVGQTPGFDEADGHEQHSSGGSKEAEPAMDRSRKLLKVGHQMMTRRFFSYLYLETLVLEFVRNWT